MSINAGLIAMTQMDLNTPLGQMTRANVGTMTLNTLKHTRPFG